MCWWSEVDDFVPTFADEDALREGSVFVSLVLEENFGFVDGSVESKTLHALAQFDFWYLLEDL